MFFFFNDTATTEIYTLSLHDALPISPTATPPAGRSPRSTSSTCATGRRRPGGTSRRRRRPCPTTSPRVRASSTSRPTSARSEEHTSELQSRQYLVCRLLLEKKKIQDC